MKDTIKRAKSREIADDVRGGDGAVFAGMFVFGLMGACDSSRIGNGRRKNRLRSPSVSARATVTAGTLSWGPTTALHLPLIEA
jgi:hypothetical protein